MESDTEQALVEVVAGHMRWGDEVAAQQVLAAIRNWLPGGVVLTRDGLAKVTEVGDVEWCDDHQGIVDECSPTPCCDLADGEECRPVALFTLT